MVASSVQEAVFLGAFKSIAAVLPLSIAMRLLRAPRTAYDCLLPVCIIISYWAAYDKFLPFPPVGAVNKLPYVLFAGFGLGIICDIVKRRTVGVIVCCVFSVAATFYIGWPLLPAKLPAVALAALAAPLVQLMISSEPDDAPPGYDIDRAATVGLASVGCGLVALLGASSASLQLCLTFAASVAAALIVQIFGTHYRFLFASRMAGVGGLHAIMCVVLLITQKADAIAALVLCCASASPRAGLVMAKRLGSRSTLIRHVLTSGIALLIIAIACAIASVRYQSEFPT